MGTFLKKSTHEEFLSKLIRVKDPNITIVGKYQHSQIRLEVHCAECNSIFLMHPLSLLKGKGCKVCKIKKYREDVKSTNKAIKIEKQKLGQYKQAQCFFPPKPLKHFLDGLHSHHIIPKFMGGDDSLENLVLLQPIDHAIHHLVRYKMYKRKGDLYAYQILMSGFSDGVNQFNLSGNNNPMKDPTVKAKHAESMKTRVIVYKTGDAHPKHWKGKKFSLEHVQNISKGGLGKSKPESMKETLRAGTGGKHHLCQSVLANGVFYESVTSCANAFGVTKKTIKNWLDGKAPKGLMISRSEIADQRRAALKPSVKTEAQIALAERNRDPEFIAKRSAGRRGKGNTRL